MSAVLADTHAALGYLLEPSQLSAAADHALTQADQPRAGIFVSAITEVEAIYLVEKAKLPRAALQALVTTLTDVAEAMYLLPLEFNVTQAVHRSRAIWSPIRRTGSSRLPPSPTSCRWSPATPSSGLRPSPQFGKLKRLRGALFSHAVKALGGHKQERKPQGEAHLLLLEWRWCCLRSRRRG